MRSALDQGPELPRRLREAVAAALDKKAGELLVLDLTGRSDFTDYFLICSGSNERQVQAIADGVVERLRAAGHRPLSIEGKGKGRWVLLDFGSFLAHIFDEKTRAFYRLERLWSDGVDRTEELVAEVHAAASPAAPQASTPATSPPSGPPSGPMSG
jgi:ribosome-associated protein